MNEQCKALKIDAIVLIGLYAILYVFALIYNGFSSSLTTSLIINVLLLCGIIYFSNKNQKATGIFGLCVSAIFIFSGGLMFIIMGVVMAYRSIICLIK